jgi:hypothetical protein
MLQAARSSNATERSCGDRVAVLPGDDDPLLAIRVRRDFMRPRWRTTCQPAPISASLTSLYVLAAMPTVRHPADSRGAVAICRPPPVLLPRERAWSVSCRARRLARRRGASIRRNSTRTAALDHGRHRVGPSMTQNSGPTGSSTRSASQGRRCTQPEASMPTSRRRPPLPQRTSNDPARRQDRARSARALPGRTGHRAATQR